MISAGHLDMMASLRMGLDKDLARSSSLKTEAHIPPLLGVAPLGPVPLSKDHQFQYRYCFWSYSSLFTGSHNGTGTISGIGISETCTLH
jgi:hypothetical protein